MSSDSKTFRKPAYFATISAPQTAEVKIKGSRFIGHALPTESVDFCETLISQHRRKYHDATHVCYGYCVGVGDTAVARTSDAGEPHGSAGAPILRVIRGQDLTNILVIVVRYFGGTKLGIGGLIQAYTKTAQTVLENAELTPHTITTTLQFRIAYDYLNQTMRELSKINAQIKEQEFADHILLKAIVPVSDENRLRQNLTNLTAGSIVFLVE